MAYCVMVAQWPALAVYTKTGRWTGLVVLASGGGMVSTLVLSRILGTQGEEERGHWL